VNFPVSVKGVLVEAGRVVLLENEWEPPDGRLEPGEIDATVPLVLRLGSVSGILKKRISWLSIKHMSA
jgi:hypothetical protein